MTTTDWLRGQVLAADDLDAAFGRCIDRAGDTMTGTFTLAYDPVNPLDAVTKRYIDNWVQFPDAPHTGYTYGRQNGGWTAVLALAGGTMSGAITTVPPVQPTDAANKQYVDSQIALLYPYIGTWQVAANTPDISGGSTTNGTNYMAVTANPNVAETAPANIPGIGGTTVHNGDRVVWSSALSIWQLIPSASLSLPAADARYLQLAGGTLTGPLTLSGDPTAPLQPVTLQYYNTNLPKTTITVGDTPPASPNVGSLWWDSVGTQLYVYYNDGNSSQWVNSTNAGSGAVVACGDTAPSSPGIGTLWFDTTGLQLYVWEFDGNSTQWLPVVNQSGSLAPAVAANTGRNVIHNPGFSIQQRGAGPWTTSPNYTADRWRLQFTNDTNSVSVVALADADRAAIGDEAALYALQDVFTGSGTAGSFTMLQQRIESVYRLSGKTITVSFWARATSGTPPLAVRVQQNFGTGGSPSATVITNLAPFPTANLSATWTRYVLTAAVPSVAGKTLGTSGGDYTELDIMPSLQGVLPPVSGTVQIWGVQLEIGSVATPLAKRDPADELALCQRFYATGGFNMQAMAANTVANSIYGSVTFPVAMRASPTVAVPTATYNNGSAATITPTAYVPTQSAVINWTPSAASANSGISCQWTASADL